MRRSPCRRAAPERRGCARCGRRGRLCSAYPSVTKDGDHAEHDDDRDGERRHRAAHPPVAARRGRPRRSCRSRTGWPSTPARYARLAEALTAAGYAVYANDHRGHGGTASEADHGYFADQRRLGHRRRRPARGHRLRPRGAPRPAGLPPRPLDGLVPRPRLRHRGQPRAGRAGAVRHRRRPRAARQGRAGSSPRPRHGARAAAREHAARQADIRPVQRGLQAQPHRLRLALARRRRGRPLRRRRAVRQHLHLGLLRRPARGLAGINDRRQVARVRRDLPILLVAGDADPVGDERQGRRGPSPSSTSRWASPT